jgi:hypothetical protein
MLLAGWEIILTPDDGAQIAQDDDLKKAFNVMIKPYVQKGIPTMNPNGGPIEMVQVKVIEEEKVEELKNKVTEFCEEYRLNRRHR